MRTRCIHPWCWRKRAPIAWRCGKHDRQLGDAQYLRRYFESAFGDGNAPDWVYDRLRKAYRPMIPQEFVVPK